MTQKPIKFIERLKKDMEGGLTSLIILNIIHRNENSWGYMIKQEFKKISRNEDEISDSTLYTTLRNLENLYGLVDSHKEERRRTYNLSTEGSKIIDTIYDYWMGFIAKSIDYVNHFDIEYNHELKERLK